MLYTLRFFLFKMQFHNANLFGSCITHILCTGCAKIKKKNNSGAKGLIAGIPEREPTIRKDLGIGERITLKLILVKEVMEWIYLAVDQCHAFMNTKMNLLSSI